MMVTYRRRGGQPPPADDERLDIAADGAFTLWRSVGWATNPPTAVGRFAGRVPAEARAALFAAAEAVGQGPDLRLLTAPGGAVERVVVGGVRAEVSAGGRPPEPWAGLFQQLRGLLGALTAQPEAAIEARLAADGRGAALAHCGSQPLTVDLSQWVVRATQRDPVTGATLAEWQASPAAGPAQLLAEPGWVQALPFEHAFPTAAGSQIRLIAHFTIWDGETPRPVSVTAVT